MDLIASAALYALVGVLVSAMVVRSATSPGLARMGIAAAALVFWPLFVPALIAREPPPRGSARSALELRIARAEERLVAALSALDGVAAGVLGPEVRRVRALFRALEKMSARVVDMEALLAAEGAGKAAHKLGELRDGTKEQIERALVEVEEIVAQLHLIRFAGSSDDEVVRRVRDLAAGIEGLAEGLLAS